jgi:hypothetical protein
MSELDQRLTETGAEIRAAAAGLPDRPRWTPERRRGVRRTALVVTVIMLGGAVIAAPAWWLSRTSGGDTDVGEGRPTITAPSTTTATAPGTTAVTTATTSGNPARVSLGEPAPVATAPGEVLQEVLGVEGVLYASVLYGETYQVVRSTNDGSTWETLLEAHPGKLEGLFAAGEVVVLVLNDHDPARDTMAPSSAVGEAPAVLVFDPATGATSETVLPRPEDPEMEGLSLNEPESCDLGGYQSWINATDIAAGDRLVVTGSQYLVGKLADGTVICDVYRNLTWTSDDRGATWELHDSVPLGAITWTGTRYVAWSKAHIAGSLDNFPDRLVVSTDGIDWTTAAFSPPIPDGSFPAETSLFSLGDTVVAWVGVRGWAAEVPDDVTDPEQLQEVLGLDADTDVEQVLQMMGVDLPLDTEEVEIVARFNGFSEPRGALIAVSNDDGLTWAISYVAEPIVAVVGIGETYIALTSNEGAVGDPSDDSNALLTSTDGVNWTHAMDLPGVAYFGPQSLTATEEAIYLHLYTGAGHAELWRIPVNV